MDPRSLEIIFPLTHQQTADEFPLLLNEYLLEPPMISVALSFWMRLFSHLISFQYFLRILDSMDGKLILVPGPIGNLEDITLRAITMLKECDFVLAEDTRNAGFLLQHLGIVKKMFAHHQHNEHQAIPELIRLLKSGKTLCMLSDAGTPGISDPGFLLLRQCIQEGIRIETLPGPTACIPALVNSGLPCDRFCFEGFLPVKKGRQTRFKELVLEKRTMIFYESPHRVLKSLHEMGTWFGADRPASVSRELSKLYEEVVRGSLSEIEQHFTLHAPKGEFVICVGGNPKD